MKATTARSTSKPPGRRRANWVIASAACLVLGAVAYKLMPRGSSGRSTATPLPVRIVLPPPPVTPPPPPPPPPEQKMVEQPKVTEQEEKPDDKPKEPPKPDEPPALGTNIKGNGPADSFGLGSGRGSQIGSGPGGRSAGSRWGWYAGDVQTRVTEALRSNRKTRTGRMESLQVRIWPDTTGRITRTQLIGSTGDPVMDEVIRNEILNGLQLREAPPTGMPLPIVLRLSARRPQ